ncbi:uncharacterized protein PITG_18135 [Phytophthora infestans T30-4]|uniref:Uncharacterized protein n=1 Tax=Phytophthora infestans (strain T30-4) TaxID=403677 RepID=D0NX40_PHYIT|nr:uncharacterized protein PITG_18135 [Phytophthora infestans T30-4]EEY67635.1 hypothetical protein PITG_18135 [Phytophthora infestans T30-4]|eukprot:XP_002896298.1 hypothetical protein PITG_18135 [Phytophthora infestans T30-4]
MLRASDRDRLYLLVRRVSGLEEQPPVRNGERGAADA